MADTVVDINTLLRKDPFRWQVLTQISQIRQAQCYLAAGCIRNMVWDYLHNKPPTPLNDIDVIYFCTNSTEPWQQTHIEQSLKQAMPELNWQVKNQAVMHTFNQDPAYQDLADAISYWPEKETAVAARLDQQGQLTLVAPFGTESLMAGLISYNPKRTRAIFQQRLQSKHWLTLWPRLQLASGSSFTD